MTKMTTEELARVRLRRQKRATKSARRKELTKRDIAKKKVVWKKKRAARKTRL